MRCRMWLGLGCLGLAAAVIALVERALTVFDAGSCANQALRSVPSPDGALRAVVFERECGATTDFSTRVTVLARAGQKLPERPDAVFDADRTHAAAPAGPGGGPAVKV